MKEYHDGKLTSLDVKIVGNYPFDATLRQVSEAGYIRETNPDLNTKEEYRANTPRPRNGNTQWPLHLHTVADLLSVLTF